MKQFLGRIAFAGVAMGFLCMMGDAAFANGAKPVRPYKARTQETQTMNPCSLPFGVSFEGEGNATHAGRTLTEGCVVFTPDPADPNLLDFAGEGSGTAANGDVVEFDIVDGVSHVFSPPCAAMYTIVFTGGTGRFEQASGSAACTSTRPTCGLDQVTTCDGTISY